MSDFCPQAVIFDMDGLLVDSEPVWAIAEAAMLTENGKVSVDEIQRGLVGLRMRDFLAGMRRAYDLIPTVEDLSVDITARMISLIPQKVVARPGAQELLDYLYAHNVPCAIASSSPMAIIDATVTAQRWNHYFHTHVCGDDVAQGKPAPDIYLEAARRLRFDPAVSLALEDSPTGAKAAVAAGIVCYAVPDPSHTSPSAFATVTPHVYSNLHEVLATLDGCF